MRKDGQDPENELGTGTLRVHGVWLKRCDGTNEKVSRAIDVVKVEQDLDSSDITITFRFHVRGSGWQEWAMTRDLAGTYQGTSTLVRKGADINDANRSEVWSFLRSQEEKVKPTCRHNGLGWRRQGDRNVFCHKNGIGLESSYTGPYALGPGGTLEGWLSLVKSHVQGRPLLELMLAIGLSSVLVHPLEKQTNLKGLLVHVSGDSSQGKTTAVQVALSAWGYPDTGEGGLLRTWYSTDNALVAALRGNWGVTVGFDESSMSRSRDFGNLIYTLAEGLEKARLDDQSRLQASGDWRTTILSTGEFPLLERSGQNTGLRVRILEVAHRQFTESAEHADTLKKGTRRHYGHAGPALAEYLAKRKWSKAEAAWSRWREQALRSLPTDPYAHRIAGKLALILATAELANKALGLELDTNRLLETLVTIERENPTRSVGERAYESFTEYLAQNEASFQSNSNYRGPLRGKLVVDSAGKWKAVYIIPSVFQAAMRELGFESHTVILKQWKAKGLLICEDGKLTQRKVIAYGQKRLAVYWVRLDSIAPVAAPTDSTGR